jgi:alkylation response protein AidB-like acyl-CoA dehydrogenase
MSADVAADVRAWLAGNWDPDLPLREWRERFVSSGWACPSWPERFYGRGLPPDADAVVAAELRAAGAVGTPTGAGMGLAAPTILEHGSDDVKARFLRAIATGEHTWCQLFSEPGSGSDLAGLTTTAVRDGDEWVVNGQKVWNTSAHHADYGMLVARTDWDVPKHRGITYFAFPMRQPGVEVRPLRQMNGHASFNEVFLTDARVAHADVIGDVGNGWRVALATLAHERRAFARFGQRGAGVPSDGGGRAVREAQAESDEYWKTYEWYPQRAGRVDLVVPEAQRRARTGDPLLRQEIAALLASQRVGQWTTVHGSVNKLRASMVAKAAADVHASIAGAGGMLSGDVVAEILVSVPAISIAGGTDEIQRNILGEQVLGLPKEPQVDRDLPFREVPRNTR